MKTNGYHLFDLALRRFHLHGTGHSSACLICMGHLNNVGRCFQSERRLCDFAVLMRVTSLAILSGNDPNAIAFQAAILETDSTPVRNTAAL